jgi:hypothetical protein
VIELESANSIALELEGYDNFPDIFELVKRVVKRFLNRHRAGLMLGLVNLGMKKGYFVGAFHPVGSNIIVMNKSPLKIAMENTEKKIYNSYCFLLLLHEYLHSLGYLDEEKVQDLTEEVCRLAFGDGHPATLMAKKGVAAYFPKIVHFPQDGELPSDLYVELVRDFDKSNSQYIL